MASTAKTSGFTTFARAFAEWLRISRRLLFAYFTYSHHRMKYCGVRAPKSGLASGGGMHGKVGDGDGDVASDGAGLGFG